jgi:hypothetical protein
MKCPGIEEILSGDSAAVRHSKTCPECAKRLDLVAKVREAFNPDVEQPIHLEDAILTRLAKERIQRGPWGIIATSVLAAATTSPIVLTAYGLGGQAAPQPFTLALLVAFAALVITLLEPKVVKPA